MDSIDKQPQGSVLDSSGLQAFMRHKMLGNEAKCDARTHPEQLAFSNVGIAIIGRSLLLMMLGIRTARTQPIRVIKVVVSVFIYLSMV
ncbi:hypothetical protein SLA2020_515140 [Shorea laevis]